jgi:hypothetical protein
MTFQGMAIDMIVRQKAPDKILAETLMGGQCAIQTGV